MHFIIAYDVTNPSRLQRQKAEQIIDSSKDDLRFYALPERGIKIALGQAPLPDGIYLSEFPELSQSC